MHICAHHHVLHIYSVFQSAKTNAQICEHDADSYKGTGVSHAHLSARIMVSSSGHTSAWTATCVRWKPTLSTLYGVERLCLCRSSWDLLTNYTWSEEGFELLGNGLWVIIRVWFLISPLRYNFFLRRKFMNSKNRKRKVRHKKIDKVS